jgi:hypothetical protein
MTATKTREATEAKPEAKTTFPARLELFEPYATAIRKCEEFKAELAGLLRRHHAVTAAWDGEPDNGGPVLTVIQRAAIAKVEGRPMTTIETQEDRLKTFTDLVRAIKITEECVRMMELAATKARLEFSRAVCGRWFPGYQAIMKKYDAVLLSLEEVAMEKDEYLKSISTTGASRTLPIRVIDDRVLRSHAKDWRHAGRADGTLSDDE